MAAAASATVCVPPIGMVPLLTPALSKTSMLEAPYAAVDAVQVPVLRFTTAWEDASFVTLKLSEPVSAPVEALTATFGDELVALVVAHRSGLRAASAAAVMARNVVLTVR